MKSKNIKNTALAGVFTAIVFVLTAYLHIPIGNGYVHVGDAFIFLAASVLPLPYALFVGIGGAILADTLTGFAVWAPASLLIKGLTVLLFSSKRSKIVCRRNLTALLPSAILCVGGYYLYEALITASLVVPLQGVLWNTLQSLCSGVVFVFVGLSCDKTKIKELLK